MIQSIREDEIIKVLPKYDPDIKFPDFRFGLTHKPDIELMLKCLISVNAKSIFEFGTWEGHTTSILAQYMDMVYTIDIPLEYVNDKSQFLPIQLSEPLERDMIGKYSRGKENVVQFYGDSTDIELMNVVMASIGCPVDSCFIDANHKIESVLSNSMTATGMVKRGGLLVWHDVFYSLINDVAVALAILPYKIYHILGTMIGVMVNDT
jgi:hypothetical protein